MEFANKINSNKTIAQYEEKITKTYKLKIIPVKWQGAEIFFAVFVFLLSLLAVGLVLKVGVEISDKNLVKWHHKQTVNTIELELEEEEEEDAVDGQVIATKNNCQSESSPLESPQPGCLDTSTLRKNTKKFYLTKKCQFKEKKPMDSNGYWIPIIFSSLTLVFWLCVVAIIYFDTHAFDSSRDSCYRNYKCSKSLPGKLSFIPVSKALSSLIYVGLGAGWMLKGWKYLKRKQSFPFFCGSILVLQGVASILYHVCPNTITKGIDVIPMQAMCILAAMKLFRSGFPRHWLQINTTIIFFQLVIMIFLTSWNLINIQKKVTAIVGLTLLIFLLALVTSLCRHGRKKFKKLDWHQPVPLCFENDKKRIILVITIVFCIFFAFWAGYFFKDKSVDTGLDSSDSRDFNQDCIVAIFDQHDMWHIFSGLFLHCLIMIVNFFP